MRLLTAHCVVASCSRLLLLLLGVSGRFGLRQRADIHPRSTACSTHNSASASPHRSIAPRTHHYAGSHSLSISPFSTAHRARRQRGQHKHSGAPRGRRLNTQSPCLSLIASAARRGETAAHHAVNGVATAPRLPMWGTRLSSLGSSVSSTWPKTRVTIRSAVVGEGGGAQEYGEEKWKRKGKEGDITLA